MNEQAPADDTITYPPMVEQFEAPSPNAHVVPNPGQASTVKQSLPNILVVDDEALLCWALAEHLSGAGFAVETAGTAKKALEVFERRQQSDEPLHAVLLDYRLPDADGTLPLLIHMRRQQPTLVVVMMSAYGTTEILEAAGAEGAVGFLNKPFDYDEVVSMLSKELAG